MQELDPKTTKRAAAFELWMNAPMPMVTIFKTFDVANLVRASRKHGCKFNTLLRWCTGKAASQIEEFYRLPADGKLMQYKTMAVNTVAATKTAASAPVTFRFPRIYGSFSGTTCVSRSRFAIPVKPMISAGSPWLSEPPPSRSATLTAR